MARQSGSGKTGGHPPGLAYLAFTEMWERFSYYGMVALLALYMTKQLLLPGHVENVWGLAAVRDLFEFRGPMSNVAFTSLVFGWYSGMVYFTPVLGGLIADRWLGANRTVMLGALLMAAGHLAMSFDETFLIALFLLVCGSGCLKGNITTQVGKLYPPEAGSLRDRGYTIFSTGINIGAVLGPLATGAVAAAYGWHGGFAVAAALMLLALAIYLAGQRHLPEAGPAKQVDPIDAEAAPADRRQLGLLVCIIMLSVPCTISYGLISGIGMIWVDQYVNLDTAAGAVPAGWFNSADSFASILTAPVLIALWSWQARSQSEPGGITKIAIGSSLVGGSSLIFAAGSYLSPTPDAVGIGWAIAAYFGMGFAFMWYWPVLLALISAHAPRKVSSTMMGVTFMSLFLGAITGGWIGSFYDQMPPATFWTLSSAIGFCGALIALVLRGPLQRRLRPAT